jgi:hypothetical protein
MCFFCSSSGAVTAETRLYVTVPLHVLVVDSPVGVHVIAEVSAIGDFAQVSLDVANIAIANSTVAVHVPDQEAHRCLGRGQVIALIVMHVSESDGYLLLVAGLTVERHQERVRIIWINTHATDCSAASGCAVGPRYVVVERKANYKALPIAAVFDAREWDIEGSELAGLSRE